MAKDPAFLFYPNDWLGGTLGMTFEEKGAYMELLMLQFNRGHMTEHMIRHSIGQIWDNIKDKFQQDKKGLWYNKRLEDEKIKRQKFTESRRNNKKGINQYTKKEEKKIGHMTEHMENENENENKDLIENESVNKTTDFLCKKFGISEMKHYQNYKLVVTCVNFQFNLGNELFKHFKDQCWNYFIYKDLEKEKLHSFKTFIGTHENKYLDGGWNAENWIKKHTDIKAKESGIESFVYSSEKKENKKYPSSKRKYEKPISDELSTKWSV